METMPQNIDIARISRRIAETKEEITYWKRQQQLREQHTARIDAGARVLIWESQLRVLESNRDTILSALESNKKSA
jgi:hypothetical protein